MQKPISCSGSTGKPLKRLAHYARIFMMAREGSSHKMRPDVRLQPTRLIPGALGLHKVMPRKKAREYTEESHRTKNVCDSLKKLM